MTSDVTRAAPRRAPCVIAGMLWLCLVLLHSAAGVAAAPDAQLIAPLQRLDAGLLAAMKAGAQTPFGQRFAALAPIIDDTFDLDAILAASVGLRWAGLPESEKATLRDAFRRYMVSSYLANFDNYSGQTFKVSPEVRNLGPNEAVVSTRILRADGTSTRLDYVMRNGPAGWRAVDVLLDGAISRVAVQRSDFRHLLANGGVPALAASLRNKVADLSGSVQPPPPAHR
jgi:phospholipid transport system substrate-binding protein